ncbi:MAG: hypothetical protein JWN27_2849 [Candidatus Eremiobacteraeota bacterium]|nr:hypothetical protein [Candidatus Eremiobacteraeota bacterium]
MTPFRSAFIRVHRWAGLTVGLLAIFLAVTGGWIVLRPLLDPLTYPQLMVIPPCAQPRSIDALAAAARNAHPQGKVLYVFRYASPTASSMVRFSDADQVYVDTCSGKVLGHQAHYGGLYGTAEGLHRFLFVDAGVGMPIIGTTSLVMALVMAAGGLFLWWPRRKGAWRSALTFNPRLTGGAFAFKLHTTVGAYAAAIVFVVAATAVPLSLGWAKNALFTLTATTDMTESASRAAAARKHREAASSAAVIPMQTAWDEARGKIGGPLLWGSVRYPLKGSPIEIAMVEQGAPHEEARSVVYVDPRTGAIVDFHPWATLNAGTKLYYWLLALHTGHFGGVFVQCLMLAGMIAVAVLGYTGIDSFLRREFRRRAAALTRPRGPGNRVAGDGAQRTRMVLHSRPSAPRRTRHL